MRYFKWSPMVDAETWSVGEPEFPPGLKWWHLQTGTLISNWASHVVATFSEDVSPSDFPFMDHLIHSYSPKLRSLIEKSSSAPIQYLPLRLRGRITGHEITGYNIANYLQTVDCLDRDRSTYRILTKDNLPFWQERPWLLGTFDNVRKITLDSSKINDACLFRLWGWSVVVIVREDLKDVVESSGIKGCLFSELEVV